MVRVQTNIVFKHLEESKKRITIEQGGSRSGKTYNILLWWIKKLLKEDNKILTISRKTLPSIKGSVMRDFLDILMGLELYSEDFHNKTDNIYTLGSNLIEFVSLDQPQKIRGRRRDYLFINEANEITFEDWQQLVMRTNDKIVIDYNPSDEFHWIYDRLITREDADFYITTYNDNPFLSNTLKKEIELLKDIDENYWRIYGLGERGMSETTIFKNWSLCDTVPETDDIYYGLDFGYNHPTALIKLTLRENEAYLEEKLYERYLTGEDIIRWLKNLEISKSVTIYADCARPELIQVISSAGYNIVPTKKGADSVKDGIDIIKRHKLFIHKNSLNLIKELKSYKWKVGKDERVLDEPVKVNDDAVDAARYAFNFKLRQDSFGEIISFSL